MVITRRSAGGIAAIWLAAVVGVSATAWFAIDRAGRDITSVKVATMPTAPAQVPTTEPAPTMAAPRPTATQKPTAVTRPSATPAPPRRVATPTPSAAPTPLTTPRPAPPPPPTRQDRTQVVDGGWVSVRCTGDSIALRSAQPQFDWRVHVDTYQGRIYVSFSTGDEEDQRRTLVTAACTNGTPTFAVTRR